MALFAALSALLASAQIVGASATTASTLSTVALSQLLLASISTSTTLPWAAFGDSWASGVNYRDYLGRNSLAYDKGDDAEIARCRRIIDAYSVQLKNDPDFPTITNGRTAYLLFQACSGARMPDIGGQMDLLPSSPAPGFATMTIGGNDAGFFDVASSCIFHQDSLTGHNYGPAYPDPSGECYKAIQSANNTINSALFKSNFVGDFTDIITRIGGADDFRLFITGYPRFFNTVDTACDGYTFAILCSTVTCPFLTTSLRTAINDLVTSVNALWKASITDSKVIFVDIDEAFEDHRFCETAASQRAQRLNAWLFTFNPFTNSGLNQTLTCDPDLTASCNPPNSTTLDFGEMSTVADFGSVGRPFHPKREGHTAIEGALKAAISSQFS